jgi:class 3 adenylate cyclase
VAATNERTFSDDRVRQARPADSLIDPSVVDIAARVANLAGPGEILATRTVRDLTVGSDLSFTERGRTR